MKAGKISDEYAAERIAEWVQLLRRRRRALDITHVMLAEKMGIAPSSLSMWERHRTTPSLPVFFIWARCLGFSVVPMAAEEIYSEPSAGR